MLCCALQVLAYVVYQFVSNFILEPVAHTCFNHTLDLLKSDPRITVRLGAADEIRGGLGLGWTEMEWDGVELAAGLHQLFGCSMYKG